MSAAKFSRVFGVFGWFFGSCLKGLRSQRVCWGFFLLEFFDAFVSPFKPFAGALGGAFRRPSSLGLWVFRCCGLDVLAVFLVAKLVAGDSDSFERSHLQ